MPFVVISDASGYALGGVLLQDGRPIAYESRQLTPAEKNYDAGERELLAVCYLLEKWRCYLQGPRVCGGDGSLPAHLPQDASASCTRKRVRYADILSQYTFDWKYRPGVSNVADPLSRNPRYLAVMTRRMRELAKVADLQSQSAHESATGPRMVPADSPRTAEASRPAVETDPATFAEQGVGSSGTDLLVDQIRQAYAVDPWFLDAKNTEDLELMDGLWKDSRGSVVVPHDPDIRHAILYESHDAMYSGHRGIWGTLRKVEKYYWWPKWGNDVTEWVKSCDVCQRSKHSTQATAGLL